MEENSNVQWWSVVKLEDGYASLVDVYNSKEAAEKHAKDKGEAYVVKGTQMWNEPLGQVEEHERIASSKYFP